MVPARFFDQEVAPLFDPMEARSRRPPDRPRTARGSASVAIPSRFFLAPLAGYTSLAFRLTIRERGGLGLATTDLVNARAILESDRGRSS